MRRLFTPAQAIDEGLTRSALRWGERQGRWRRIDRAVWGEGPERPDDLDAARARVLAAGGVARGRLAGVLHGRDSVDQVDSRPLRRAVLPADRVVEIDGIPCANGLQTLVDLASELDGLEWEQALESALRKRLVTVEQFEAVLPGLGRSRVAGTRRIREALVRRPDGAPATESLLETLLIQLAREVDGLPEPTRQHEVYDRHGNLIARVDICWPGIGLFIELDGQQHQDQPVYDARRETAVVAVTGWLPGRFTWRETVTLRRVGPV